MTLDRALSRRRLSYLWLVFTVLWFGFCAWAGFWVAAAFGAVLVATSVWLVVECNHLVNVVREPWRK